VWVINPLRPRETNAKLGSRITIRIQSGFLRLIWPTPNHGRLKTAAYVAS